MGFRPMQRRDRGSRTCAGKLETSPSIPAYSLATRQAMQQIDNFPELAPGTPTAGANDFRLLDAYVGLMFSNWEVTFGKQSLWWGPGNGGPLDFSDNVQPINMFRINRTTPLKLPSILGWLGPMRTEFFLGQLDGQMFLLSPAGFVGQLWADAESAAVHQWSVHRFQAHTEFRIRVFPNDDLWRTRLPVHLAHVYSQPHQQREPDIGGAEQTREPDIWAEFQLSSPTIAELAYILRRRLYRRSVFADCLCRSVCMARGALPFPFSVDSASSTCAPKAFTPTYLLVVARSLLAISISTPLGEAATQTTAISSEAGLAGVARVPRLGATIGSHREIGSNSISGTKKLARFLSLGVAQ